MRKYGDVEKIEVVRGKEAQVLNDAFHRTGKATIADFDDAEKQRLYEDLEAAKEVAEKPGKEAE